MTTDIGIMVGCSSGGVPQNCGCGGDACGACMQPDTVGDAAHEGAEVGVSLVRVGGRG